jgi:hypothetical protein
VLNFTCHISPSLINIVREQSSEELIFLSDSPLKLGFIYTDSFIRLSFCCLQYFSLDHLSPLLGALKPSILSKSIDMLMVL